MFSFIPFWNGYWDYTNKNMTKLEILKDTYEFYTADPNGRRAFRKETGCVYKTPDNKKCAFGRFIKNELIDSIPAGSVSTVAQYGPLDFYLKDEYKGHGARFWGDVQDLHDNAFNWDENTNTITEYGENKYQQLIKKYEND